jgi:hypothetical protein
MNSFHGGLMATLDAPLEMSVFGSVPFGIGIDRRRRPL